MTVRPVNSVDHGSTAGTPVFRAPQTILSHIDRQSETTETLLPVWIRTLCQRLMATPCSGLGFLLSLSTANSFRLMSPKRPTVAPVPTTAARRRNHHKRRLTNVPVSAGITRPKLQQPYSRALVLKPFPPTILSSQQNPMVSTELLEILAEEAIRTIRGDGRVEEFEAVTKHEDSHQDVARRGAMSCRRRDRLLRIVGHLMSCSSSAMSASLLEHSVLRTLATEKFYLQTLEHFLLSVAKRNLLIFNDTQMITALTVYSNAHYYSARNQIRTISGFFGIN